MNDQKLGKELLDLYLNVLLLTLQARSNSAKNVYLLE